MTIVCDYTQKNHAWCLPNYLSLLALYLAISPSHDAQTSCLFVFLNTMITHTYSAKFSTSTT